MSVEGIPYIVQKKTDAYSKAKRLSDGYVFVGLRRLIINDPTKHIKRMVAIIMC